MKQLSERMNTMATKKRIRTPAIWTIMKDYAKEVSSLEQRPAIKISDGDVWLVFPNALISIDGLCAGGVRGKITRHNIKKWRDALLAGDVV